MMIRVIVGLLAMGQALLLRLALSDEGVRLGMTQPARSEVGLYFRFILTDKNELHYTLHPTREVLRNVDLRMTLNTILVSCIVILLNKHTEADLRDIVGWVPDHTIKRIWP